MGDIMAKVSLQSQEQDTGVPAAMLRLETPPQGPERPRRPAPVTHGLEDLRGLFQPRVL